jgi:micrococcal nuclease
MRKLFFALATMFFLIGPAHGGELAVDRVVDGDTVYLSDGAKIRLYGIDAPERRQPYGLDARDALAAMAAGPVRSEATGRDRYGRTIAVVWIDGVNVNRELIRMGAAWVYPKYCTADFCDGWEALESTARDHRRGLWADPDAVPPWEWRRR